jgi:hypothetical protein
MTGPGWVLVTFYVIKRYVAGIADGFHVRDAVNKVVFADWEDRMIQ